MTFAKPPARLTASLAWLVASFLAMTGSAAAGPASLAGPRAAAHAVTAGTRSIDRLVRRGFAVIRHDLALRRAGLVGGAPRGLKVTDHRPPELQTRLAVGLAIECHRSAPDGELVCEVTRPRPNLRIDPPVRVWKLPIGTGPVAGVRWRF